VRHALNTPKTTTRKAEVDKEFRHVSGFAEILAVKDADAELVALNEAKTRHAKLKAARKSIGLLQSPGRAPADTHRSTFPSCRGLS
jgi:hypothetical protein